MGLADAYDHVKSQMLLMDPLPSVGKACSMLLRVEKQRKVQTSPLHDGAISASLNATWKQGTNGVVSRRQGQVDKRSQYYDHCRRTGHTRVMFLIDRISGVVQDTNGAKKEYKRNYESGQ
ncbi:UNVERIFIED_CONTAM: hypothetical protein Scaly_0575600 [Sesamum calycinum]|uniref:Uncharacterized protein n=1 Tax=Sesamum calycinum TaxID=2727403 RepID=A0AAW2RSA6_9LAMI